MSQNKLDDFPINEIIIIKSFRYPQYYQITINHSTIIYIYISVQYT
jgi:hypothetical protein